MKLPRLGIRGMLILVALAGLATGLVVLGRRSIVYRELAVHDEEVAAVVESEALALEAEAAGRRRDAAGGVLAPGGSSWESLIRVSETELARRRRFGAVASDRARKFRWASYLPWELVTVEPWPP